MTFLEALDYLARTFPEGKCIVHDYNGNEREATVLSVVFVNEHILVQTKTTQGVITGRLHHPATEKRA